jgi:Flp pilus assembly protein TadG
VRRRRLAGDVGATDALGLALLAPASIGLALAIVFLGRGVDARATTQIAAEAAAQAAAQERTPASAEAAAQRIGAEMLDDRTSCSAPTVDVDTSDFRPGGVVGVTVWCGVSTDGLELISPPSGRRVGATAMAMIDPFRGLDGPP